MYQPQHDFASDIRFLICGSCNSKDYENELKDRAKSSNITFDFRFIPDEEISGLVSLADAVILPYSQESVINSGVAYLAFSYGKTIISTDFGTAKDLKNSGLIYVYSHRCGTNQSIGLTKSILSLYDDWNDKELFEKKGKSLKNMMISYHNSEMIGKSLATLYASLFRRNK